MIKSRTMKIALIQMDMGWETPAANMQKARAMISEAALAGADVAALPEMFATGFSMDAHRIKGIGSIPPELSAMAKDNRIALIAGVPAEGISPRGLNKALAYDSDGTPVAEYTKMHPFSYAGEDKHYAPGSAPVTFMLSAAPSSVFICYDLRFPEVFRKVAKKAMVIYVLANWPAARQEHWEALLRARAIENQCFIIGVNRTGTDGNNVAYAGGSAAYGPFGDTILMGGNTEGVLMAEIEPEEAVRVRQRYPFLTDMR